MCEVLKVVCVGVVRKEELKGAGRGTEANVDRGCTEFGTGTRYRGPGSQTCRRQEETKQRGTEADRNRNAHGNRLHSDQLGPTADRKREGARREGQTAGPGERGGAARPGWGRGLWDEANDGKGGLERVANGRASRVGAWPLVGSQWQGVQLGRGQWEREGGGSQTPKAVGAGRRGDNLSSPLPDELGHALLVAPAPPPHEALRVAPGPSRSASSSCPRGWGGVGVGRTPAVRRPAPTSGRPKAACGPVPADPPGARSAIRDPRRRPWARESAQRTTCRGGIRLPQIPVLHRS